MDNIQELILDGIEQKLSSEKNWREKLADTLFLSKSTIYKRLNGITPFTPEEIAILVREFGLSFDAAALGEANNRVMFKVPPTHQKINSFNEYLQGVGNTFRPIQHYKNVQVYMMTRDLPLFWYFRDVDVSLFKLYAYGRFMWELDSCLDHPFSIDYMHTIPGIKDKINGIWDKYAELDTVEYWQTSGLDVTFQQIQFFWESGVMSAEEAYRVLDGLSRIIASAQRACTKGKKSFTDKTTGGSLEMYHNRIMNAENIILATTDEQSSLHIILDPSRFIVTFDTMMTATAKNTIDQAKKNAYAMGEGSGNVREGFFTTMEKKIEQMKKKIEHLEQTETL